AGRLGRDYVEKRPALHSRENCLVERLCVFFLAEDEAGARARERLVRGRRDEVAMRRGVRVQAGRDETGEMGHVAKEQRAHLVGDLAEAFGLDPPRIGRPPTDDQLWPALLRE